MPSSLRGQANRHNREGASRPSSRSRNAVRCSRLSETMSRRSERAPEPKRKSSVNGHSAVRTGRAAWCASDARALGSPPRTDKAVCVCQPPERYRRGRPGHKGSPGRSGLGNGLRAPSSRRRENHHGDVGRGNESPAGTDKRSSTSSTRS